VAIVSLSASVVSTHSRALDAFLEGPFERLLRVEAKSHFALTVIST